MSGLFSSPKTPSLPPVPKPAPLPEIDDDTGDFEAKKVRERSGFRKAAFITGQLTPDTGKKAFLG